MQAQDSINQKRFDNAVYLSNLVDRIAGADAVGDFYADGVAFFGLGDILVVNLH